MVGHSNDDRWVRRVGTAWQNGRAGLARSVAALFGALTLAIVGLSVLAPPAFAASPTISVSPSSAAAGARVTVSGTGWNPSESVTINVGTSPVTLLCHVTTNSTGTIAAQTCTVPTTLPDGPYAVSAEDSGSLSATGGTLTIGPSITLLGEAGIATATAAPGQSISITGAGFSASSSLSAKFGATAVTLNPAAVTNTVGSISGVSFTVPSDAPAGVAAVTVKDASAHSATYDLDIYGATISHAPAHAASGQPVTFSGSGWPANDSISVRLVQGANTPVPVCTLTADTTGSASPESCTVPTTVPRGSYTVVAVDGSISVQDSTPLVLQSGIVLLGQGGKPTPDATPGQQIQVTGSGFAATSTLSATFDGVTLPLLGTTLQTTASGSFTAVSFDVPTGAAAGKHSVVVSDGAGNKATYSLVVYKATITASLTKGVSGRHINFTGSGWPGEDTLTISLVSSTGVFTNTCSSLAVTTNSDGGLDAHACTIATTIPQGTYTVTAVDGFLSESATAKFTLEPGIQLLGQANTTTADVDQNQTVGIVATGFAPSTELTVEFGGTAEPTTPSILETGTQGSLTTSPTPTFVVPGVSSPKTVKVTVLETGTPAILATFTLHVFKATITPAATSGISGHQLAFTGSGWPGNDPVNVRLVFGTNVATVCQLKSDTTGNIEKQTCPVPNTIPDIALDPGTGYTLNAEDTFINYNYSAAFTVDPGITMELVTSQGPTTNVIHRAAVGQVVGVLGTGFGSNSYVTAEQGTTSVVLTSNGLSTGGSTSTGSTTPEFTVQSVTSPGPVTITITDGDGDVATFTLDVYKATISHSTTGGSSTASGHRVTLTGSGWPGSATINVTLSLGTAVSQPVCTISADSTGTIAAQTCTVPTGLPANEYKLDASDNQIYIMDTATFVLTPGLTLYGATTGHATTTAAPGQSIGVTGTGYAPATALTAKFGSTPVTLSPAPTIVTSGTFSGTAFTVPAGTAPGQYVVTITDADADSATYDLTVYNASITDSSNTGAPGQPLEFSGSGWPANDPVTVRLVAGSSVTTVCTIETDSTGTLDLASCNVPTTQASGTYTVNATDGSISVNDSALLTVS